MAERRPFVVEFTERVHRNIRVRAYDEQEAVDWVEEHWDEACELDRRPDVECEVDYCYAADGE